jgi:hypothetical protein
MSSHLISATRVSRIQTFGLAHGWIEHGATNEAFIHNISIVIGLALGIGIVFVCCCGCVRAAKTKLPPGYTESIIQAKMMIPNLQASCWLAGFGCDVMDRPLSLSLCLCVPLLFVCPCSFSPRHSCCHRTHTGGMANYCSLLQINEAAPTNCCK